MSLSHANCRKYAIHGPAIEVDCSVPMIAAQVDRFLAPFSVPGWPEGFVPTVGTIRPYTQANVLRHLSPTARPVPRSQDLAELYEEGERFWMIDDRWGMSEINFLKGQWRSWVLPQPKLDSVRCTEMAVLWPMAQLLRARGIYLLPAASAVRDGWGVLLFSKFGVGPELSALVRDGYKIIGQRWTAVREEDGRLALLHLPGQIERTGGSPQLRSATAEIGGWLDLCDGRPEATQNHAFCDAVLVTDSGRRPRAQLRHVTGGDAVGALRRAWPIVELHPQRRYGQLPAKLAHHCRCGELQLSRNPRDLLTLLTELRAGPRTEPSVGEPVTRAADRDLALTPWAELSSSKGRAA